MAGIERLPQNRKLSFKHFLTKIKGEQVKKDIKDQPLHERIETSQQFFKNQKRNRQQWRTNSLNNEKYRTTKV